MALTNLSSDLLNGHSHIQVEEFMKQGNALQFNSGKNQRVVRNTLPSIELTISYKNIDKTKFDNLKSAYEINHSNTFELSNTSQETLSEIDARYKYIAGSNASTYAFREFKFSVRVDLKYTGTIKLISSVFFDYPEYQDLFTQASSYSPVTTADTGFITLMETATPYQVNYEYLSTSLFSNIGQSARHIKDRGGLRKKWTLSWLLSETVFLALLKFYRMRGGIMSDFGMPDSGVILTEYLKTEAGYFITTEAGDKLITEGAGAITKAIFMKDSFKYDRNINGLYSCRADIVEVL
jgi:hypothetical protein